MIWAVMASMVALLIGTPMASAEQTTTESVKSIIDAVIHIFTSQDEKRSRPTGVSDGYPGVSLDKDSKLCRHDP
jgi:hypothetical protein